MIKNCYKLHESYAFVTVKAADLSIDNEMEHSGAVAVKPSEVVVQTKWLTLSINGEDDTEAVMPKFAFL